MLQMISRLQMRVLQETRVPDKPHRPLRILWDTRLTSRGSTGIGTYATRKLEHLRHQPGIEIQTLSGWYVPDKWQSLPIRAIRLLAAVAWTQAALPTAAAYLKPDVLHVPVFTAPLWGTCPLVVTVYDTVYRRYPDQYPPLFAQYLDWFMPRGLKKAAAIIAISETTKQDVVEAYHIEPSRIHVIYLGVDHDRFNPNMASEAHNILENYGIRGEYVLYVGALVARKNIPLLLEAVGLIKARGQWGSRQVVIAGAAMPTLQGYLTIQEAVVRFGLQEDVIFTGHVPDDWLPALYARATVLAFPSRYEGFGLPLVESMASGTPVVAVDRSSVTEVLGDAGLLVPGGDAEAFAVGLLTILEKREVQRMLRHRGLKRAAEFTWELAAQRTVELYREIV